MRYDVFVKADGGWARTRFDGKIAANDYARANGGTLICVDDHKIYADYTTSPPTGLDFIVPNPSR